MLYLVAGNYFEARNYADDDFLSLNEWAYVALTAGDCPTPRPVNLVPPESVPRGARVRCVGTFRNAGKYAYLTLGQMQAAGVEIEPGLQPCIDFWEWR